jgi:hypothetical protein
MVDARVSRFLSEREQRRSASDLIVARGCLRIEKRDLAEKGYRHEPQPYGSQSTAVNARGARVPPDGAGACRPGRPRGSMSSRIQPTDSTHGRNCTKPKPGLPCGNPHTPSSRSRVPSTTPRGSPRGHDRSRTHLWHLDARRGRRKQNKGVDKPESIGSVSWPRRARRVNETPLLNGHCFDGNSCSPPSEEFRPVHHPPSGGRLGIPVPTRRGACG